jgi:hypothetical protein
MTSREWRNFASELIDGLERQLCSSAPKRAKLQLAELRECASKATTAKARKAWERRCDRLGESTPFFRGAVRRHIGEQMDIAIDGMDGAIEAMAKLAKAQGNTKAERGIAKTLADFRKKRRKPVYKPIHSIQRRRTGARVADLKRSTEYTIAEDKELLENIEADLASADENTRWQAAIHLGRFAEFEAEPIWPMVVRWGSHSDEDVRTAIATCVLEHILEYHFEPFFERVREIARSGNRLFADTFTRCWSLGQAKLAPNVARFEELMAECRKITRV